MFFSCRIGHFQYIKYSAWKWGSEDKDNRNTWELMWKIFTYHPLSFVFVLTDSLSSWIFFENKLLKDVKIYSQKKKVEGLGAL